VYREVNVCGELHVNRYAVLNAGPPDPSRNGVECKLTQARIVRSDYMRIPQGAALFGYSPTYYDDALDSLLPEFGWIFWCHPLRDAWRTHTCNEARRAAG